MMTAMIADRFHMQMHHTTEDVPMYALTLAPGGPKLQRAEEGDCIVHQPGTPPASKPQCIFMETIDGPNLKADAYGMSPGQIAHAIAGASQLPVLDKTGLTGIYNLHLKWAPDPAASRFPGGINPFTAPLK